MLISPEEFELLVQSKLCNKCREEKPLSEYWKKAAGRGGLEAVCKDCARAGRKAYRETETGKHRAKAHTIKFRKTEKGKIVHRESSSKWQKTESGKASHNKATKRYKANNPDKQKAHGATAYALRTGELIKEPCERCGEIKVEGHHPDYAKPLEVVWLCKPCHTKAHEKI